MENYSSRISVIEQILDAERRYYVAVHQYDRAARTLTSADTLERLRVDICAAFAELTTAQNRLLDCADDYPQASNDGSR